MRVVLFAFLLTALNFVVGCGDTVPEAFVAPVTPVTPKTPAAPEAPTAQVTAVTPEMPVAPVTPMSLEEVNEQLVSMTEGDLNANPSLSAQVDRILGEGEYVLIKALVDIIGIEQNVDLAKDHLALYTKKVVGIYEEVVEKCKKGNCTMMQLEFEIIRTGI